MVNIGVRPLVLAVNSERDFEPAFAAMTHERAEALLVTSSPYFNNRRVELIVLAARHQMPTIYEFREFVDAGGLMSYGTSLTDGYRQIGVYAGRILRGAKAADLPVVQPTRFELIINLKTAKALGLDVPPMLLARAPAERPTRFQLVINLKTAKTLGLEVPPTLLARADEVIE